MSWKQEIDELKTRTELSHQMGGEDKVARQHKYGKLTVRERLDAIVDSGSFQEIGALAGKAEYDETGRMKGFMPSNFVFGFAEIDNRPVMVSGDDFTVRAGSGEGAIAAKRNHAEGLAVQLKIPHIRLVDGMAGGGSVKSIEIKGRSNVPELRGWDIVLDQLGTAPSVSLALGSVAGLGAARVATSHYSVIVSKTAQMMVAGPAVVDGASMGRAEKEELGHARIHTRNGSIDDAVETEAEAFERARRFLSYLPTNTSQLPPVIPSSDSPQRRDESLAEIIPKNPRKPYSMRKLMASVLDMGSMFEIGANWGTTVICCLARLDGVPVAVFGGNPKIYGGAWTADAARKLTRFIDLASTFNLPLIHLEDCPGFIIGKQAEETGTIRFGAQVLAALGMTKAPFCSVIVRKAFGVAGSSNFKSRDHHMRCAWPSAEWGSLPIEGGIEVAYKAELAQVENYEAHLEQIKERLARLKSPFRSAEFFEIEDIIDPRDTRPFLCRWVNLIRKTQTPEAYSVRFRP